MEGDDLFDNLDWDPVYLSVIFNQDFFDMSELWSDDTVTDGELLEMSSKGEMYCPVTEDIAIEDRVLAEAVDQIESEYVFLFW